MGGALAGLLLGLGIFSLWWSTWPRPEQPVRPHRVTWSTRLQDELVQAGFVTVGPGQLVALSVLTGMVVGSAFALLTGVLPVAAVFGLMAAYLPLTVVRSRARSRRTAVRDLWPDVVDNIASGVRAGLALPEALAQVSHRGPVELRPAFSAFAEDYRATGRFHDCLDRLKARLADPVGDRIVESLRIARDVGGSDLGRLLRTLSTFLREDARTRAELETRQSWTVNAARLAVAAPWIVLAMLATRPESLRAYAQPRGALVLLAGAVVTFVAYRLMVRIGRLPDEERVLR